jgi:predicted DNA-binding transcriptional regulator YafY
MNRTDRLLAIVLELQGKGRQRAEDLAATFETSKRTIYRDMLALGEAGVPIVSVPGRGYSLMKGYFLPPLSFTTEEATMLLLGSEFMAHNFDAQYRAAAQSASRKIEGVLPENPRGEVQYLRSNIRFIVAGMREDGGEVQALQQLRRAIIDRVTVRFQYHARYGSNGGSGDQVREADPYGLAHVGHSWYLVAYCHLRKAMRNFRLERMDNLELLPQTFIRPANFDVGLRSPARQSGITVKIHFDHETSRWARESRWYDTVSEEETEQGLLVTLKIRQESEIMQWLLGWGRHVRVLEPASLRELIAQEAQVMVEQYKG